MTKAPARALPWGTVHRHPLTSSLAAIPVFFNMDDVKHGAVMALCRVGAAMEFSVVLHRHVSHGGMADCTLRETIVRFRCCARAFIAHCHLCVPRTRIRLSNS